MEYRRIYAKIDFDALDHNVSLIKSKLPNGVGLMPIIKADAYGHGSVEFARHLSGCASYFGVAAVDEAAELRRAGITTPILILGYTSPALFEQAVNLDITLAMFSYEDALLLDKAALKANKRAKIHIAVDTGMSRIGYQTTEESADEAAEIAALPHIEIEGMFSHFATADEADKSEAEAQRKRFVRFAEMLRARGVEPGLLHLDNSAGIMEMKDSFYDMARAGIILYGLYPSEEVVKEVFPLRPVMELITHISHIKTLPPHRGISYGRTYVTDHDIRVATIPVGYADGYPRALSGRGRVLISGVSCPILGRVCMDQMMADISSLPDAKVGDKVTLVGTDGEEHISVEELAEPAASFNYEFVCNIGRRVPRAYFSGGRHVKTVSYLEY